ncbi:MAG: hypothetical protein ACLP8S_00910 [Solirubrobacteraceae bacterium]
MIAVRLIRRAILATAAVAVVTLLAGAAPAGAAAQCKRCMPWWHLTESVAPTHLWLGTDEVQEVVFSQGAIFGLKVEKQLVNYFNFPPHYPDATPAYVQTELERVYGAGDVEVTEAASGEPTRLIVKAIGSDAGRGVPPLEAVQLTGSVEAKVSTEGGSGVLRVRAFNLGDTGLEGTAAEPVTIADRLPAGVIATSITAKNTFTAAPLKCELATVSCTYEEVLAPFESLELVIGISLTPDAQTGRPQATTGEQNVVSATGGHAPVASIERPITVSGEPTPFGVSEYSLTPEAEGGATDTQAGSHPFQLTTTLSFDETRETPNQPAQPRDLRFDLPAGLVGDATSLPQCSPADFDRALFPSEHNSCPADAAVGVAEVAFHLLPFEPPEMLRTPVYNLVPQHGEPATFGFGLSRSTVVLNTSVRAGGDYGVTASVNEAPESVAVLSSVVTLWGDPGNGAHNASRGWSCLYPTRAMEESVGSCDEAAAPVSAAFLTLPTSCTGTLQSPMTANSWVDSTFLEPQVPSISTESLDGCDVLPFEPQIELESSTSSGDSPTELSVHLKVPQEASEAPEGIAESDVRNTTVTLPAGLQVNPAAAGGLEACSEADIGFERYDEETKQSFFHEETEQEREGLVAHQECPEGSKLGTVKITTPLLSEPLEGAVYQAAQGANPFGSLLALYVVAENKNEGVRVRLAGKVEPNPSTGQLTSTFDQTPQLPFEEFDLKFFGGPKAPLATSSCGTYRTDTSIEPWSGNAAASPFSEFDVTTGPDGVPCSSLGSFAPAFLSGTANNDGDAFSPFTMTLSRRDGEQTLGTVAMTMPPGLLGMLSKVALCGEEQANAGSCPAASQIGHVTVQAGVGSEPVTLPEAGKHEDPVYLTGPYGGGPFGLAIVVHPEAGPFNLEENGRPVIVRAKIEINSTTAQVSIASNPMPTRLRGIPLDVRTVNVTIDREGFMFNPTNCEPMTVAGTIGSSEGASESVSSRFQATNCASLPFTPKFTVLTDAKTSKAGGAYLHVKVVSGPGQANIGKVKVDLPVQLPSRLTTLQKACTAAVFEANLASCPAASVVGEGTAVTPVLKNPLKGPAYLVSHGGAKFPDLEIVLQGEGITLILDGNTDIKKGITSSIFRSVPDAPISTFDLVLPEGPHSVLGTDLPASANYSMCGQSLAMPTEITGQNGAVVKQTTKIAVSGCPKAKKAKKADKGSKASAKHGKAGRK